MNAEDDKPQKAVALKYDGSSAPRVVAKGEGHIAEQIIALARENGVPMREDTDLVQLLAKLDLEQAIPVALYLAVAEVLAFAYQLSGKTLPGNN